MRESAKSHPPLPVDGRIDAAPRHDGIAEVFGLKSAGIGAKNSI